MDYILLERLDYILREGGVDRGFDRLVGQRVRQIGFDRLGWTELELRQRVDKGSVEVEQFV